MSDFQYLQEGLDPTPLECISKADILQMVRAAKPYITNGVGGVIASESAPDVVTYPEQANFIWMKIVAGTLNGEFYYYNGTSWQLLIIVNGALLADGTVTLSKLNLTGSTALDIIQVNASNNGLIFTSLSSAITAGSIGLTKLANGGGSGNFILTSISGTNTFYTPTQLAGILADNTIALAKLIKGDVSKNQMLVSLLGVNQFIDLANIVTYLSDNTISITKLAVGTGAELQSIRRNVTNTAWEFYTPPSAPNFITALTAAALPAGYGTVSLAHTLGAMPKMVNVVLVNTTTEWGYAVGEELAISSATNGSDTQPSVTATAANVLVSFSGNDSIYILSRSSDARVAITRGNWQVKAYVSL